MTIAALPAGIKWRNSTYVLVKVVDDTVYWRNPYSGYCSNCTVEMWKNSQPYSRVTYD